MAQHQKLYNDIYRNTQCLISFESASNRLLKMLVEYALTTFAGSPFQLLSTQLVKILFYSWKTFTICRVNRWFFSRRIYPDRDCTCTCGTIKLTFSIPIVILYCWIRSHLFCCSFRVVRLRMTSLSSYFLWVIFLIVLFAHC